MKKNEDHIHFLQDLLNNQDLNSSDLKTLFKIYNSEKGNAEIKDLLEEKWSDFQNIDSAKVDSRKILSGIKDSIQQKQQLSDSRLKTLYQWTSAAAAVVLVTLFVSTAFFFDVRLKNKDQVVLHEITAPNGEIKKFDLPDGTKIWLNPGSSLIYSENMTKEKIRDVRLLGQAFFEVAKDSKHPFILQLGDIGLRVVGTSFNASNFKDDSRIEIALKSGQVKLFEGSYQETTDFTQLKPGQLAKYDKGKNGFKISAVDILKYTSWIDGVLIFQDDLMSDVFKRLGRWYNVKIIVKDPLINNYLYTATIKNESIEQILKLLEYTSRVKYEIIKNTDDQTYESTILIKNKNTN
ncbi:MAG TPA: FecR domain-containing protein [Prolixibacteraceae bacterium]|nr:FecR domain-containing protein [Prolixibacteraceae bacterium]